MEITALLDRCIALERGAGEVYRSLATRAADAELGALWSAMAQDEDEHARKLGAWRVLAAAEPPTHPTCADGFESSIAALEQTVAEARRQARQVASTDEAFAIALGLEGSELDTIYIVLLQASPIARFPDLKETYRQETNDHHRALLAAVHARSTDPHNRLAAEVLGAAERDE